MKSVFFIVAINRVKSRCVGQVEIVKSGVITVMPFIERRFNLGFLDKFVVQNEFQESLIYI